MEALSKYLIGGLVAVSTGSAAVAITSPNFVYTKEKTGYYTLGAEFFRPLDARHAQYFFAAANQFSSNFQITCGSATIHLPEEAEIQSSAISYTQGASASAAITFYITRYQFGEYKQSDLLYRAVSGNSVN